MLEVRHLSAHYGQAQALFDISFQVAKGSMVLIQGLNGAGKSTLLKSLMGLMPQVQGEIFLAGRKSDGHGTTPAIPFGLGLCA